MACPSLLQSTASSFHGQSLFLSPPLSVHLPYGKPRNGNGVVSVKATGEIVLVEKSEAEKTSRLKTTYLEKIIPLLKNEFNYINIHQVINNNFSSFFLGSTFILIFWSGGLWVRFQR